MAGYKQTQVTAKDLYGNILTGGICEFENADGRKAYLMIHKDHEGKATVSEIEPTSIVPEFDCWAWLEDWLNSWDKDRAKEILEWIHKQPMCME